MNTIMDIISTANRNLGKVEISHGNLGIEAFGASNADLIAQSSEMLTLLNKKQDEIEAARQAVLDLLEAVGA